MKMFLSRLKKENQILTERAEILSRDYSRKIELVARIGTILASSFYREYVLSQIIAELKDFYPELDFELILKDDNLEEWTELVRQKVQNTDSKIHSFPFLVGEQLKGYLVIKSETQMSSSDYQFFSDISGILSSALQNISTCKEKNYIQDQFGRSVDPRVRDYILSGEKGSELSLSVMFFDIRSFTTLSEKLGPVKSVEMLNNIFEKCDKIIRSENGFINKFTGDGFMAVFGAPVPDNAHHSHALNAAIKIRQTIDIKCGMGIASGKAMAGTIGSEERKEYTVIGDTVNVSSRVEGMCKVFGASIITTQETFEKANISGIKGRKLGPIRLKGKANPVILYDIESSGTCYSEDFDKAVALYYEQNFDKALELFNEIQKQFPEDIAVTWFINRCGYRKNSDTSWDGVETMTSK